MKRILILYTSVGSGHKYLALNVAGLLKDEGYEVVAEDILKVEEGNLSKIGKWLYLQIVNKRPEIWDYLYRATWIYGLAKPISLLLAKFNSSHLETLISDMRPDMIIATQISASSVVSYLEKENKYKGVFAVAFSDYHFHPFWMVPNADVYFVNIEEQKKEIEKLEKYDADVKVVGMSLQEYTVDNDLIRKSLGFSKEEKIVVLAAGSLGIFSPQKLIDELLKIQDLTIVVLTGKNSELKIQLDEAYRSRETKVRVWGFKSSIQGLYAISSLIITKPGGLTVAEALQVNLPIVITHVLPGQELLNLEYLLKNNLLSDARAKSYSEIREIVERELKDGALKEMLQSSKAKEKIVTPKGQKPKILSDVNEIMKRV